MAAGKRRAEQEGKPADMPLGSATHQKSGQAERNAGGRGEALSEAKRDVARLARHEAEGLGREDLAHAGAHERELGQGVETRQGQSRQCRGGWVDGAGNGRLTSLFIWNNPSGEGARSHFESGRAL